MRISRCRVVGPAGVSRQSLAARAIVSFVVVLAVGSGTTAFGQDEQPNAVDALSSRLSTATRAATEDTQYTIAYQFEVGEIVRWDTKHEATTMTRINKVENFDRAVTKTVKVWRIKEVKEDGTIVIEQSIDRIALSQSVAGGDEIRYDSSKDEQPPLRFESIAGSVGVPLALVSIAPNGKIKSKEAIYQQSQMGLDDVAVPLPDGPVKRGDEWYSPSDFVATHADGREMIIKLRKTYTLQSVKNDIATIDVRTEVLTPFESPRILSQLMQEMTEGTIRFDIARGRLLEKSVEWDEEVVGFSTPQSYMQFNARFTETLVSESPGQETPRISEQPDELKLRGRDDGPVFRK